MTHYIDGFAFPIPTNRLDDYKRLAEAVSEISREHGALEYHEYTGNDMNLEGTRSFVDCLSAREDETIVFGWIVFDSREIRDRANEKVAADARMVDLVESSNSSFKAERMAYGGFRALVRCSDADAV